MTGEGCGAGLPPAVFFVMLKAIQIKKGGSMRPLVN